MKNEDPSCAPSDVTILGTLNEIQERLSEQEEYLNEMRHALAPILRDNEILIKESKIKEEQTNSQVQKIVDDISRKISDKTDFIRNIISNISL